MDRIIKPFIPNGETLDLPTSKSFCHRYLIAAYISNEATTIHDVNFCDDIIATINGLKAMGAEFEITSTDVRFIRRVVEKNKPIVIDANLSASTLRLLIPIASYLFDDVTFVGGEKLFSRPLEIYEEIFAKQNLCFAVQKNSLHIKGNIRPTPFVIKGDISSQFVSGLLFLNALTLSKSKLSVSDLKSENYVKITLKVLKDFGYDFADEKYCYSFVKKSKPKSSEFTVEKDYSAISNFAVLGSLSGAIRFKNINMNSLQPDARIFNVLNVDIKNGLIGKHDLYPISLNIENSIDLGPILFVLCSFIEGTSYIFGIERLKIKESDRLEIMVDELRKAGVDITYTYKMVKINGKQSYDTPCIFNSHGDHRVAMALTIFATLLNKESTILDADCVSKSFPTFYEDLEKLAK